MKEDESGVSCSTHERVDEKCIQSFDRRTRGRDNLVHLINKSIILKWLK
jgi:hypothetical protein